MFKKILINSTILIVVIVFEFLWLFLVGGYIEDHEIFDFARKVFVKFNYPISQLTINDIFLIAFTSLGIILILFLFMTVVAVIAGLGQKISERITED
jgi:hypothetical protein